MKKFLKQKSTKILRYPSFFKGVARIFDLFGSLDQYKYSNNPDAELIHRDWEIIGYDLKKPSIMGKQIQKNNAHQEKRDNSLGKIKNLFIIKTLIQLTHSLPAHLLNLLIIAFYLSSKFTWCS